MVRAARIFQVRLRVPAALAGLEELAMNLRWAWHRPTRELFRRLDPAGWERVDGNPVELLADLGPERLEALAADADLRAEVERRAADLRAYLAEDPWRRAGSPRVAYCSPEFGLTSALPTYAGGLGVLAGDHLKAASDLGLPLLGVGLLYRHGYFHQRLDADGWQREEYADLRPASLPLRRLERGGAPATVSVDLAGREVACQVWRADVGRVPLLLLDSDVPGNEPEDRAVTDRLYGGDREHRIRQEIVLGVGGVRAVALAVALGELPASPDLYHSNEGHAVLLQLERLAGLVDEGLGFDEAVEAARAAVLFTTHTPVPAGIDVFERPLAERYLTPYAQRLGVGVDRLLELGRAPDDEAGALNMAVTGLRLSARSNGVSRLHGRVARRMFAGLWPGLPVAEVPIDSVTNGVHAASWVGPEAAELYDRRLGPGWEVDPGAWERAAGIDDGELWEVRQRARRRLVEDVRARVRRQRAHRGEPAAEGVLDPEALTIGFARRFAAYKRPTLLLDDLPRLRRLLCDEARPVQLVISGKAHPRDDHGKELVRQLVRAAADPELHGRIVFVEDYDIHLARSLCAGVDLWLNTPRRPLEACGTSGQKAVLNGALHCSTLDGWWDEMAEDGAGWSIGTREEDDAHRDAVDAHSLFELIEHEVVPAFHDRDAAGVPVRWIEMVRRSLTRLGGQVLATRMVAEYADRLYTPLGERTDRLRAEGWAGARDLAAWRRRVAEAWGGTEVVVADVDEADAVLGGERTVRVEVAVDGLDGEDLLVEALHGPVGPDGLLREHAVEPLALVAEGEGSLAFEGTVRAAVAGAYGVAVRAVPVHPELPHRHDVGLATWADGGA